MKTTRRLHAVYCAFAQSTHSSKFTGPSVVNTPKLYNTKSKEGEKIQVDLINGRFKLARKLTSFIITVGR